MIGFLRNNLGKTALIFLIVMLALSQVSKSVGFCSTQMRFISDEEYIEMMLKSPYRHKIKLTPTDTSVKAYIKNHPSCCRLDNDSDLFYTGLFSKVYGVIHVNYPLKDDLLKEGKPVHYEGYIAGSVCGDFIEETGITEYASPVTNFINQY